MSKMTDNDIQEFLDGDSSKKDGRNIINANDPETQESIQQYSELYSALDNEIPWSLDSSFAARVLDALPAEMPFWERIFSSIWTLAIGGGTLFMAMIIYYVDFSKIASYLEGVDLIKLPTVELTQAVNTYNSVAQTVSPVMMGAIVLLLLFLLDKFILREKLHKA